MTPGLRKLAAILGVCLVFALGMAAGSAVTLRVVFHRAESLLTRHGSDQAADRLARGLSKKLRCDDAQSGRVAEIVRSAHGEMWKVRSEAAPQVLDIYRRAVAQIRGVLRPDQVKILDETVARQAAHLHLDENDAAPIPAASTTPAGHDL